ncbi:MAG: DUF885 domain-containing protein [Hungatella sp.]|nr:DUF885 domain-containing protein [Hungatella sp.]
MKSRGRRTYQLLTILFLIICLLCGCIRSPDSSGFPDGASLQEQGDASKDPEQFRLESQNAQEEFESLCQTLFKDELSQSYLTLHYSLTDPESYGITDYPKTFGAFSLEIMKENVTEQEQLRKDLAAINPEYLTDSQRLTYRILTKTMEYEHLADGLELYYQPLAPSTGVQAQLPILLTEFAFYRKQDVEDYLTLLSDIDSYYQQILDFEKEKAAAGLFMTDACVDQIVEESNGYLLPPQQNLMVSGFDRRIDAMEELTEDEKADFKARNLTILTEHFIPAYELLLQGLSDLKGSCNNEQGLCYDPDGKAYYEYLIQSSIGTTYDTMDELKKAIENQINSDLLAIAKVLKDHPDVLNQMDQYAFSETEPEKILELLKERAQEDFPEIVSYQYVTKFVPEELKKSLSPAFFLVPPINQYDNCVIYINQGSSSGTQTLFTTLAHEGIPGHLYQNVYFLSNCDANIRKILTFLGYSEGWASYVENYCYTIENGLSPELGQVLAHNASATLGIHALMDLNINYYGWNEAQVEEYLKQYFDLEQSDAVSAIYQAMKNDPSNYMAYYVGYLEIISMRDRAQEILKGRFKIKEFHRFLLDIGPAPFTVIEPYFEAWVKSYQ